MALAACGLSMSSSVALAQEPAAATAQPVHPAGVRFAEGPVNGALVAIDALKSVPDTFRAYLSTPSDASLLEVRPPLAMYQMDARAVAAGGSIESFRSSETWYYVLMNRKRLVAGVTLRMDGGRLRMSSVHTQGPFLDAITPAVDKLLREPQLQSGSYEARLLVVPGGSGTGGPSQAIWLKSDASGGDLIFALAQPAPRFRENRLYPVAEFLKLLAPIIRQDLKLADRAK
jgi:hypothetical protein